jgi:hypothetical protein
MWPVFLSRVMYNDDPVTLRPGAGVSWNVSLVDGEAEGWPADVLIDAFVEIEEPPEGATRGLVARTPDVVAAWGGRSPVGSRFHIRAGLEADWFNPPFPAPIVGEIRRLAVVSRPRVDRAMSKVSPIPGRWLLHEIASAPAAPPRDRTETWCGLLVGLAVSARE